MNNVAPSGRLLVVSIPIGNDDDITLRAIKALGASDVVVCEEEREGRRLLRLLDLQKPLQELNEHSDSSDVQSILDLLSSGSVVALVSDAGTPLLADPGQVLIRRCLAHDIGIEVVPGASSILTAVVRSGFDCGAFLFAGFVRRVEEERLEDFRKLASEPRTIILLEAPYRLRQLLSSAAAIMPERRAYVGCNLTMPSETHHYGTIAELSAKFTEKTFKGEFVVCIQGTTAAHQPMIDDMQTNDSGRGRGGKRRGGPGGQHPPQGRPPRGDSPKPWPAPKANYDDEQPRDNAGVNGYAPTPRPYDPNREQRPSRPQRQGAPRREGQGGPRRDGPDGPRRDGPDGPRRDGPDGPRPDNRGPRREGQGGPRPDNRGPRREGPGGPRPDNRGPRREGPGGPRPDNRGPRREGPGGPRPDNRGPRREGQAGPYTDNRGPRPDNRGPRREGPGGPRPDNRGPRREGQAGPNTDNRGPRREGQAGPYTDNRGPRREGPGGPRPDNRGPRREGQTGPYTDNRGPRPDNRGPRREGPPRGGGQGRSQGGRPQGGRSQGGRPQGRARGEGGEPNFNRADANYSALDPTLQRRRFTRGGGTPKGGGRGLRGKTGSSPARKRAPQDLRGRVYTKDGYISKDFTDQSKPTERTLRPRRKKPPTDNGGE